MGLILRMLLGKIFKKHGIRLKALGLKDASAVTEQFVFTTSKMKHDFEINEPRYSLKKIGFTDKTPVKKKRWLENHFQIKIDGASDTMSQFEEYDRILNFYGYQRFWLN